MNDTKEWKTVCMVCVLTLNPTVRQLICKWIWPFSPSHLCWGCERD